MSRIEDRKKASCGKDRMMYCQTCMVDQECYSAAGHRQNQMLLHCVQCGNFMCKLIRNYNGDWEYGGLEK